MLEYSLFKEASYEPLKTLISDGYTASDIEMTFYNELSRRFFMGEIN